MERSKAVHPNMGRSTPFLSLSLFVKAFSRDCLILEKFRRNLRGILSSRGTNMWQNSRKIWENVWTAMEMISRQVHVLRKVQM